MNTFEWDIEVFGVGIPEIDQQHQRLFGIINEFLNALETKNDQKLIASYFDELVHYTRYHFSAEERIMEVFRFPDQEIHKATHRSMIYKISELRERYGISVQDTGKDLKNFLANWLMIHIKDHDKKIGDFANLGKRD